MNQSEARIIPLDEFRRRRQQGQAQASVPSQPAIVWVPVWFWVPVLTLP